MKRLSHAGPPPISVQLRATEAIPALGLRKGQVFDLHLPSVPQLAKPVPRVAEIAVYIETGGLEIVPPSLPAATAKRLVEAVDRGLGYRARPSVPGGAA